VAVKLSVTVPTATLETVVKVEILRDQLIFHGNLSLTHPEETVTLVVTAGIASIVLQNGVKAGIAANS